METVTIPVRTYNNIDRTLNRVLHRLNSDRIGETITENEAAIFLEVSLKTLRQMVKDEIIPASAYITTVNNNKRFFKEKLIK